MRNNKLKLGIIGCGRIGERHIQKSSEYFETIAVYDSDKSRLNEVNKKYKLPILNSIDEFYQKNKFDLVAICTPNGLHAKNACQAMEAGFNVIVEKPMALSIEDAGQMINTSERTNKRLFVVKQNRFNPPIEYVKELIIEKKLGKLFSFHMQCSWNRNKNYFQSPWKGTKELDGGTLYTQFSHFLDLLLWLLGDIEVLCSSNYNYNHPYIQFEDTVIANLKTREGALGTFNSTINAYSKNMEGSLTFFFEKGTLKIGGQYLNTIEYSDCEFTLQELREGNTANNYGNYLGSMSNHDLVYKNVYEVLIEGKSILTSGFDGYRTVQLIEKLYAN